MEDSEPDDCCMGCTADSYEDFQEMTYESHQKQNPFFFSEGLALLTEDLLFLDKLRNQTINPFSFKELIDLQRYLGDRTIDSLKDYTRYHASKGRTSCFVSKQQTLDKRFVALLSLYMPIEPEVRKEIHQELVEYVQEPKNQEQSWGNLQASENGNGKRDIIITKLPKPKLLGSIVRRAINGARYYAYTLGR